MILSRLHLKLAGVLAGAVLFYLLGAMVLARAAHADAGAPPAADLSWQIYLGIAIAAAGGALKIIDVLLAGFKWLAPRTETTLDDSVRDGLQTAHDKLDEVLAAVRPAARTAVGTIGMLLVLLVMACGARERGAAAAGAFLDCEAPEIAPMLPDLLPIVRDGIMLAISGDGHVDTSRLKTDMAPAKSALAQCAFAAAIAALTAPAPKGPPLPAAAGLDAVALRGAFASTARELGWAPTR